MSSSDPNAHSGLFIGDKEDEPSSSICYRSKSRRPRTSFQEMQLNHLEDAFQKSHYPSDEIKRALAHELGIPFDRVTVWFQNRRAKWRRDRRKSKMTYLSPPGQLINLPHVEFNNQQSTSYAEPNCWSTPYSEIEQRNLMSREQCINGGCLESQNISLQSSSYSMQK